MQLGYAILRLLASRLRHDKVLGGSCEMICVLQIYFYKKTQYFYNMNTNIGVLMMEK